MRHFNYYVADLETTTIENTKHQNQTDVWLCGYSKLFKDEIETFTNLSDMIITLRRKRENIICFFHNLKFDGQFIVSWLLNNGFTYFDCEERKLTNYEFSCCISDMGQWYSVSMKTTDGKHILRFADSFKLLPFSLKRIGIAFQTQHQKLEIDHNIYRPIGYIPTDEEETYFKHDILVLREAMEIFFSKGHTKMTIGSCALEDFLGGKTPKNHLQETDKKEYKKAFFPDLTKQELPECFGSKNTDHYVRKSYRGGWCYLNPSKAEKIIQGGDVYDVNSLYPSVMHSQSNNKYPIGLATYYTNRDVDTKQYKHVKIETNLLDKLSQIYEDKNSSFVVRFKSRFKLKNGYLPFIQIKNDLNYKPTEHLTTSDFYCAFTGNHVPYLMTGENHDKKIFAYPELTLTEPDFMRFLKHYDTSSLVILDFAVFSTTIGIFDDYIDKHFEEKQNSTGAKRELAKLFLNNLYGKLASSEDSSHRIPYLDEDGIVQFETKEELNKKTLHIASGSYVTAYAREFTIHYAQLNYDRFIYADTDSLHLENFDAPKGIITHPTNLLQWSHDKRFTRGKYVKQKTYINEVQNKDGSRELKITCAGMNEKIKTEFKKHYDIDDFSRGLVMNGKLLPKRVRGGVILVETTHKIT